MGPDGVGHLSWGNLGIMLYKFLWALKYLECSNVFVFFQMFRYKPRRFAAHHAIVLVGLPQTAYFHIKRGFCDNSRKPCLLFLPKKSFVTTGNRITHSSSNTLGDSLSTSHDILRVLSVTLDVSRHHRYTNTCHVTTFFGFSDDRRFARVSRNRRSVSTCVTQSSLVTNLPWQILGPKWDRPICHAHSGYAWQRRLGNERQRRR